ncbi:hypothetical protein ACYSNM_12885 [Myroides sp. LJL116]
MNTYRIEFSAYNPVSKVISTEQETLEYIVDIDLDNKPTKEEKKHLEAPCKWAQYAYENNKNYYLTYYLNDIAIACVSVDSLDIIIEYLALENNLYESFLRIVLHKYNWRKFMKDIIEQYPDGNLFLSQIDIKSDNNSERITKQISFDDEKGIMGYYESIYSKTEQTYCQQTKEAKVNVSSNYLSKPLTYVDYAYLLDYRNLLHPEYLDYLK